MRRLATCMALAVVMPLATRIPLGAAEAPEARIDGMPRVEDHTLLWWAQGPPSFLGSKEAPAQQVLCFQSGLWGLAFDTEHMRALRAGRWPAPMGIESAIRPGRADLSELPAVPWACSVVAGGRRFECVGHEKPADEFLQSVRFVESGRFFQRAVIEGLKFATNDGVEFPGPARLEISAWPDRLAFRLEIEPKSPNPGGSVELRFGDRSAHAALTAQTMVRLEAQYSNNVAQPEVEADPALKVAFDDALGCRTIELPETPWTNAKGTYYPEEQLDRLDRWPLRLRNPGDEPAVARLMFVQRHPPNITGFTPMLCEADGSPTGLPVQISKNWHRRPEKGTLPHEGPWFHGCAFVRLPPKSERALVFQMVHARYGGVFAASHAQLSLIGWGHNQFWDQAAVGSFGESICLEPGRVQRRCFIDDVRPLLTLPQGKPAKPWGWADNCGGGDFLMVKDTEGHYLPMRATRTDYRAYGPCLTDVGYSEESKGGEVAARMDVSVPQGDDFLRTFLHLRYDVFAPVRFNRLAFFQLGADFYNETPSRRVAVGDRTGVTDEWEPKRASDEFDRRSVPLSGEHPWVSIHGLESNALQPGRAAASRGIIVRSWRARLGGKAAPAPCVSFFCTEWGKNNHRTVVELAPPVGVVQLLEGDFVEADLELVVFPARAEAYYGPNQDFRQALALEADTWRLVHREAEANALDPEAQRGRITRRYPIRVAVDDNQCAEFKVRGSLGHVPVTFTGLRSPTGPALSVDGKPFNPDRHGNDFWQADYDPATHFWRMTFCIPLPAGQEHTVRFEAKL